MPKLPPKTATNLAGLGQALLLADSAEAFGLLVHDFVTFPERLKEIGLPSPSKSAVHRASQLQRDRTDAVLWRGNGWIKEKVEQAIRDRGRLDLSPPPESPRPVEAKTRSEKAQSPAQASPGAGKGPKPAVSGQSQPSKAKELGRAKTQLWGIAGTAILRWLGSKGLSFAQIRNVCSKHGLSQLADATIKTQMRDGATGKLAHGPLPSLTKTQEKELLDAANAY